MARKNYIGILLLFQLLLISNTYSQQVSLFNSSGEAVAYIDFQDNNTIYLYDGSPVGFLENDGCNYCVYALNGTLLGWYTGGIIYDRLGYPMVVSRGIVNMQLKREPDKQPKRKRVFDKNCPMSGCKVIPELRDSWSIHDFKMMMLMNAGLV